MAKTFQQLIDDTRQLIGQPDSSNSNFDDVQIGKWINDAYRRIVVALDRIPLVERDYTVASQAVTLNQEFQEVKSAKFLVQPEGEYKELEIIRFDDLMRMDPDWENADTGKPVYFIRKSTGTAILYPPLNSENQGGTLRLYAIEMPTELSATSDIPDLPSSMHDLMPHYAAFRCFLFLGQSNEATVQITLFRGGIKDERSSAVGSAISERRWKWSETED